MQFSEADDGDRLLLYDFMGIRSADDFNCVVGEHDAGGHDDQWEESRRKESTVSMITLNPRQRECRWGCCGGRRVAGRRRAGLVVGLDSRDFRSASTSALGGSSG